MGMLYLEFVGLLFLWHKNIYTVGNCWQFYGLSFTRKNTIELLNGLSIGLLLIFSLFVLEANLGWVNFLNSSKNLTRIVSEGLISALGIAFAEELFQPIDGLVMAIVYLAYLGQAVFRGRQQGREVQWTKQEMIRAIAGVVVLAIGAYFTVTATENIVGAIGISEIIGGLFITAPMAMLPELFATWSVTRSGQVTAATTSVIGDHAVTMTIAFVPLALATAPVNNLQLYSVNLAFVALMPALYAAFIHWGGTEREHGFGLWQVIVLDCVYLVYLAVMLFGVLNVL